MEKAVHITNFRNLKYFQKGKHQRIYWGVEFCQNLIPNIQDTGNILRFIKKNGLKFSFITPFVTERGLKKLNRMFVYFKKKRINSEIVVNDWGVLECLNSEFNGSFELVLGRLLVRQQRDPVMKKILEKQPPFAVRSRDGKIRIIVHRPPTERYQKGIRASYVNSPSVQSLLSKFGIKRVELNNLIQGLNLEGIKLKKSLYTPFVNISTSRFCPMESDYQKTFRINVCNKECQSYYDILRSKAVSKTIYRRGNTTFYKNPIKTRIPANLTPKSRFALTGQAQMDANVDRIVFQPELPF